MLNKKRLLVFLIDICLIATAYVLSFLLRFDFFIPHEYWDLFLRGLWIVLAIKPIAFLVSGLYRNLWRYASLNDAVEIFKVITISSVMAVFVVMYVRKFDSFPRSIFILDWVLLFSMVSSSRLVWRVFREMHIPAMRKPGRIRALIVGAGEAGSMLLRELRKRNSGYEVVGFVDDDREKQGMLLQKVPVVGTVHHLKALVRRHKVEEIIVAIPSAQGKMMRHIIGCCEKAKVAVKTVPGLSDIISGKISISQFKDVEIEDLLGREAVVLNEKAISSYLTGKKILVSGAAGSIGSEICRQVARFNPAKIILVDAAETPLFYTEKELAENYPDLRVIPVVVDIRNRVRIDILFDQFVPDVVFHAAAYKHVPMMEYNPVEAVTNNILGTQKLADAAHRVGVKNFVMISTDKAVNPTNIMGASKRAAEIYVQALARKSVTKFTTVRFGNVLGSNGSVIPIFKEQIKKGGPITVTDPDIMRYFMTIPEATQLVLQAGCIGNGGEIFVLDMGEPVRIVDLAEELIRLSGLVPYEDIDIVFSGLRPGEKLFEELLIEGEGVKPTSHDKIKIAAAMASELADVVGQFLELAKKARMGDIEGIVACLQQLVPEFLPSYNFVGAPPIGFQKLRPDLFQAKSTFANVVSLKNRGVNKGVI